MTTTTTVTGAVKALLYGKIQIKSCLCFLLFLVIEIKFGRGDAHNNI
jgi:hypothetical protein